MAYVEKSCTFKHQGRTFEAGGAWIGEGEALVYIDPDRQRVTNWHGQQLGEVQSFHLGPWHYEAVLPWRMAYVRVRLNGALWWGRYNYDDGSAVKLHKVKGN